jgi:hypothetical protein
MIRAKHTEANMSDMDPWIVPQEVGVKMIQIVGKCRKEEVLKNRQDNGRDLQSDQ